jgi:hypothetical protein
MARQVVGIFPDRESADHALQLLEPLGVAVTRDNVEAYGNPEYYEGQLPQGATALIVEHSGRHEPEIRKIMMRTGAMKLQGRGTESQPSGMTEVIDEEPPTPVEDRERALGD